MSTGPALPPARHALPKPSFGRVSVGVHGRVMVSVAEGPFDAPLMAAVKRAIALAGKRLPADRRFGDLLEIRGSLQMDADALQELRRSIDAFGSRGIVALSTVFLVRPGIPGIERLPALMDIWRASRPVRRADNFESAWALVNADLAAAGLPTQQPPTALMTEALGLQWPLDAKGKRSTGAPGQRIVAAALRGLESPAADAVIAERDWRHAYPAHWLALVQAQAARPVGVVASARAGLAAAWGELPFLRGGKSQALVDAMRAPGRRFQTLQLHGSGEPAPARWTVPHQGRELSGDALARQIDRWEKAGICEAAHAAALRDCLAHPEWFDLSDQHLVLLGAGSEAGPLAWLAKWRANLVGIDLARATTWKRIAATVAAGNATLTAPVAQGQPLDVAHAGADLLADTPEIAAWLAALGQPLSIANLAYLDGERHVRVSLAMDAISATLCAADARTQLAYMATPTDVFAVPEELGRDVMRRYAERGVVKKLAQFGARLSSGGRGFAPHMEALIDAGDFGQWGLVDALVVEQGPNYALAKRLQQWRALVARADGHRIAFNVAPSTTTASVVSNPVLAAGFRGAKAFGVEVFAPATTNALMAAMWVHQLRSGARDFAHPLKLLVHTANHGGLWRLPYRPRSVLPMAALLGFVKRR